MDGMISIIELAEKYHMTTPSFYHAMKRGHIKFVKHNRRIYIDEEEYKRYVEQKHSNGRRIFNGGPLYDEKNGEISIQQCSKFFGIKEGTLYNYIRKGFIPSERRGKYFILKYEDCEKYFNQEDKQESFI